VNFRQRSSIFRFNRCRNFLTALPSASGEYVTHTDERQRNPRCWKRYTLHANFQSETESGTPTRNSRLIKILILAGAAQILFPLI
jgi:hypothetical protein